MMTTSWDRVSVKVHEGARMTSLPEPWTRFAARHQRTPLSYHPDWLLVLRDGLGHTPYCLEAVQEDAVRGLLPLCLVRSWLFGRFLVSLPYLNYGGAQADDPMVAALLIDQAQRLAERLDVKYLELRHEVPLDAPGVTLTTRSGAKVHMRRDLPATADRLWTELKASVRNQVRKGCKGGFTITWGGEEALPEFFDVFSRNMRDLGTPVFGKSLFRAIMRRFPDRSEFCVADDGRRPVAAALLLHGWGVTEVPSASTLRSYHSSCVNMLLYWKLLERAIARGSALFDFGRGTPQGPTHKFKQQWGAQPGPAEWQYHVRRGLVGDMRPDNHKYARMIKLWRRLPVGLTRVLGPPIVRGVP